jgi:predicted phage terminase large subunit-like protein
LDDIENDENTQSPETRDKLFDWFTKAILKAGSNNTNVIVIGTIQHYDSLLAKLTSNTGMPGWDKNIYKAVISYANRQDLWQEWSVIYNNRGSYMGQSGKEAAYIFFSAHKEAMLEGTEILWPEKEDYYSLMVMREQDGTTSFDSEKQNNPIDDKSGLFNPEKFHYWDDQYPTEELLFEAIGDKFEIYGACDPSTGKQGRYSDYSAIITIALNTETKRIYVLDADIAKRTPNDLLETIISYCQLRHYRKFAIEANQFQGLLAQEIERRSAEIGLDIPIEPVTNSSEKLARIQSLEPKINTGYIQFSRKHTLLLEQLKYFPKGRHDDGPDALEMAVRISKDGYGGKGSTKFVNLTDSGNGCSSNYDRPVQDSNERDYGPQYDIFTNEDDD